MIQLFNGLEQQYNPGATLPVRENPGQAADSTKR
jgi:hypothetical protein